MQHRIHMRGLFTLLFVLALILNLSAEANSGSGNGGKNFYIEDVAYNITGRTMERILAKKVDIRIGKSFSTKEELEAYLEDRHQVLINQRVLSEAEVKYTTTMDPGGRTAVHVAVYTRDTWNIIVLPYMKYDSNKGLLLSMRGRDFNFLGSMQTLILDLDFTTFTPSNNNEYGESLSFTVPFRLVDHDWRAGLEEGLTYIGGDNGFKFHIVSSLAVDFPMNPDQDWTLQFSQGYYYDYSDAFGDTSYNQSKVSFGTDYKTLFEIAPFVPLHYAPSVFFQVNYMPGKDLSDDKRGYEPGFKHEVYVDRVDWIGDFRDGQYLSLGNTIGYKFEPNEWDTSINWEAIEHKAFSRFGLSGRISGFYQFNKDLGTTSNDDTLGEPIRGIADDRLAGNVGVFLNTDLLVKMWLWKLEKYFEVQIGPFYDMAFVKKKDEAVHYNNLWYGGGLQTIVFLKAARSLYLRVSLGFDLQAVLEDHKLTGPAPRDGKKRYDAFIGLGHHY